MREKVRNNSIVIGLIVLTVILTICFQKYGVKEYARYSTDTLHYEQGNVVEVSAEEAEYDEGLGIYLGSQVLQVEMLEGEDEGEIIEITNYLTNTHSVYAKVNTKLIICADRPENIEPYYTVYNYDRRLPELSCVVILALAILAVGGGKGIKAIAGLAYSMFLIIYFVLPAVFSGYSPIMMSIICAVLSTAVTLLLLNGQSKKTAAAILATTAGVLCTLILFMLMSSLLHLNGSSSSEAEGLILIQQNTGLKVKDILFAGVLISSLGAIMDVGMSIVSSLYEICYHNPKVSRKELFASGIRIGKDMIGTMTNTLILAFTGSAFVTLLVFVSYQVQFNQLFNSNYLSIEIAQGVCGTFGIVLTVPAASAIAATFLIDKKNSH
ncbi:MAG: YibE/F family protein [Ruminococcus sp.]|nr:YibE/F family protein [Ruminococcus sp.]